MILPQPRASMPGTTARLIWNMPLRLAAMIAAQACESVSQNRVGLAVIGLADEPHAASGIVDQHRDRPQLRLDPRDQRRAGIRIRDVAEQREYPPRQRFRLARRGVEFLARPRAGNRDSRGRPPPRAQAPFRAQVRARHL